VAQQVLEYLGVPHDQPLKTKKEMHGRGRRATSDDAPSENTADLNAMFADVNNLPADDPLRAPANAAGGSRERPACCWLRKLRLRAKTQGVDESVAGEGRGCVPCEWRIELDDAGRDECSLSMR
jgi:hypothetical protein